MAEHNDILTILENRLEMNNGLTKRDAITALSIIKQQRKDLERLQSEVKEQAEYLNVKKIGDDAVKEFVKKLKEKYDITNFDYPYGCSFKIIDNCVEDRLNNYNHG